VHPLALCLPVRLGHLRFRVYRAPAICAAISPKPTMPNLEGQVDRARCGGTVWDPLSTVDWDLYTFGKLAPFPIETAWVVSPCMTPVAVQTGSIEHMLCMCAYREHEARMRNLLDHPSLDVSDIHPGARADALLFLKESTQLNALLLESPEAREYVCSLQPAHTGRLDLVEQAQELCQVIEARAIASAAADECLRPNATTDA